MVANGGKPAQPPTAVLFSAGLDSAVLLAQALQEGPAQPLYVRSGLAWEVEELTCATRLLAREAFTGALPLVSLDVTMRDVYPPTHWALRGEAPAYDTPDEDVYLEGRNVILLSKAAVFMARAGMSTIRLGPLAGNPFPDATAEFFTVMADALSRGLARPIRIETPLATLDKADVIRLGHRLGVPLGLTLSCMQPSHGSHCGACSKCRERHDGFLEASIEDPTEYRRSGG